MNRIRRGHKVLALAAAATLVVAACGSDDDSGSDDTTVDTEATTDTEAPGDTEAPTDTEATTDTEAPTGTDGEEPAGEAAFRITYELSDTAVWNDGTDITVADFQCGLDAVLGTPGSLSTTGYDAITSISEGETPKQIVVEMNRVYAPYKTLFDSELLKADEFEDCNDVSTDFAEGITFSGREWLLESWTPEQLVYVPNPGYTGEKVPQAERMVIVPAEDGTTLLKSGAVDFIFPQAYTGIDAELDDPNVEYDSALGGSYEALYFMQVDDDRAGPFSDDAYREAFARSIDLDGLYNQIYAPFAQGTPLLTCGPIAPGPYCDPEAFTGTYDPAAAETLLTDAGWAKNDAGMWASPEGEVPQVRWMVNTGNTRRESAQAYLIPLLAEAGFDVVADNCEALPCVFETRLPGLDYDFAMYISTVSPDPTYLNDVFECTNIPTEENDFQGQNQSGWCNEEAPLSSKKPTSRSTRRLAPSSSSRQLRSWRKTSCCCRRCSSPTSAPTAPTRWPTRRLSLPTTGPSTTGTSGKMSTAMEPSSSVRSSSRLRTARTRSPSAPTRRGSCGPLRSRCSRHRLTQPPIRPTRSPRCWPASQSSRSSESRSIDVS